MPRINILGPSPTFRLPNNNNNDHSCHRIMRMPSCMCMSSCFLLADSLRSNVPTNYYRSTLSQQLCCLLLYARFHLTVFLLGVLPLDNVQRAVSFNVDQSETFTSHPEIPKKKKTAFFCKQKGRSTWMEA